MSADTIELFYEKLGFEIASIDDMDTLFLEIEENGDYATVTDYDGRFPESLEERLVFSAYDDNDSFQWSATLPSSFALEDIITKADDIHSALDHLQASRQEAIDRYNQEATQL